MLVLVHARAFLLYISFSLSLFSVFLFVIVSIYLIFAQAKSKKRIVSEKHKEHWNSEHSQTKQLECDKIWVLTTGGPPT